MTVKKTQPARLMSRTYFAFFLAMSAVMPYLTIYYEGVGMTGKQIGLLAALPALFRIVANPLWGGLADIMHKPHRLLTFVLVGAGVTGFSISLLDSFAAILPIMMLHALMMAPVIPLMDSGVLRSLNKRTDRYGKIRLWGSLGWVVGSVVFGRLIDLYGFNIAFAFFLGGMLLTTLFSLGLRPEHSANHHYFDTLRELVADSRWLRFIALLIISGFAATWFQSFLGLRIKELGGSNAQVGIAFAFATFCEVFIFYFGERILRWRSAEKLIFIAVSAYVLRLFATGLLTHPTAIIITQALHGLNFGLFSVAAIPYAHSLAPDNLKATAQGLLAVFIGLGAIVGALCAGWLLDMMPLSAAFQIGGVIVLSALVIFKVSQRRAQFKS